MRRDLLEYLECPLCAARHFRPEVAEEDAREVREGRLVCSGCQRSYTIRKGIVDLLANPSDVIESEQKGWIEMLGQPPEDEMTRNMLLLPYHDGDIWETTADNFDHGMELVDVRGKRVIDIGAGRCWSARRLVQAGARGVLALDILLERFIGLETADIYLEHDDIHFERILGDMHRLPVAAGSFDVAFMTGTLHHSSEPLRVMKEMARVLTPGGTAVIVNEPVCSLLRRDPLEGSLEIAHGINENVYTIWTYLTGALRAGLRPWFFFPRSINRRFDGGDVAAIRQELGETGFRVVSRLWRGRLGRRLGLGTRPLLALVYLVASMPLVMIAGKR